MDWIEQLFGLNPDHGNGSVEVLILGALAALTLSGIAVAVPAVRARLRRLVAARARRGA
jgi:hypothetical protein